MALLASTQVANYATQAGFKGNALTIAVAIAQAESSFNTIATNTNTNGSVDRGLWQINSTHTEYNASQLFDPLYNAKAAYAISSQGANFAPWTTYTSGAYKKYLSGSVVTTVKAAASNTYPQGQCTWWASERYHQLSGYYVPWNANAKDWASRARSAGGWNVSSSPSQPSIIVLNGGVQQADPTYGHVAIVEKVNTDGSVYTSDLNWGLTSAARSATSHVTFRTGPGVSFITANGVTSTTPGSTPVGAGIAGATFVPLLEQVHQTLINVPGFYGMALALDEIEEFPGYINLATSQFDVTGIVRSVGATVGDNFPPVMIRGSMITIGVFIMLVLIIKVVLDVGDTAKPFLKAVG